MHTVKIAVKQTHTDTDRQTDRRRDTFITILRSAGGMDWVSK